MSPVQPHTVSREARTCASCHASSKALGYGTHDGRYMKSYTKGVYVDVASATGEIISKNAQLQIPAIPELPMDLDQIVTRWNKQRQTVGHHWPLSGPLPKEVRDRMEKVGVCISCHKDFTPGIFNTIHQKNFHRDIMDDVMKPGSFFHQLFEFREEQRNIKDGLR
jgi:hypothetical protein